VDNLAGYRVAVRVHLVPGVGAHRLDRLQPEHLERLYVRMMAAGSSAGTAHQAHRTVRTALGEAVRRGYLVTNPATLAKAPRLSETEVEPFSIEEVQRILTAAGERRNGARWAVALALGLRQGEALGLRWPDVDLDTGTLTVRRSRNRPRYEHGCGGTCGKDRAGYCPSRRQVRADAGDTKSANGRRVIGLPAELVKHPRCPPRRTGPRAPARRAALGGRRLGLHLTHRPAGQPETDYHEWKRLLRAAGVREARLHDARHTAATVLLVLGVPERAVMSLMGWADTGMAKRYQHVTGQVRRNVAERVGNLLWSAGADSGD
jgi:integrase